jgi:hypothetical protein
MWPFGPKLKQATGPEIAALAEARGDIPGGFRFVRAENLLSWQTMRSYEMIVRKGATAWFPADEPPALALFVSHRWLSPTHPDPDGVQIRALHNLLAMIVRLATAVRLPLKARVKAVPSLMKHGVIQAAFLSGAAVNGERLPVWESWSRLWRKLERYDDASLGAALLAHIGFWYDYSCLPQAIFKNVRDKSATGFSEGQKALFRLHELAASLPMLILRCPGDDYESRAWCGAELAMGHRARRHLVLRTDLLGEPISPDDLLSLEDDALGAWPGRKVLVGRLGEWETGIDPLLKRPNRALWDPRWIFLHWQDLPELDERRPVPFFTTPRMPDIFAGPRPEADNIFSAHRRFLMEMFGKLEACSDRDFAEQPLGESDVGYLIVEAMFAGEFICSEQADMIFVGTTVLQARHQGIPDFWRFYDAVRQRCLRGQTLRLARYRERRKFDRDDMLSQVSELNIEPEVRYKEINVWYLFEDEPLEARPMPQWARI